MMVKFGSIVLGLTLFVTHTTAQDTCSHLVPLLWDGPNPARLLAKKLEPQFTRLEIDQDRILEVVHALARANQKIEIPEWNYPPYPQTDDPIELANFYLILNSINYSFFDPKTGRPFKDGKDSGSSLATKRLVEAWPEISQPDFLTNIEADYVRDRLFAAETPISLIEARTAALREAGHFILQQGSGGVLSWLQNLQTREAGPIAVSIPIFLPSWRDPFFKRAQLFVAMLYGRFQNRADNPIEPKSLAQLTVFADYRLPQTLRAMGILWLSGRDDEWIESNLSVAPGSHLELELRAASILAADFIVEEMNRNGAWGQVGALEADFLLWSIGRSLSKGIEMPGILVWQPRAHRSITTDY